MILLEWIIYVLIYAMFLYTAIILSTIYIPINIFYGHSSVRDIIPTYKKAIKIMFNNDDGEGLLEKIGSVLWMLESGDINSSDDPSKHGDK